MGTPTIENAFGVLRQTLGASLEDKRIPRNPCDGVMAAQAAQNGYMAHGGGFREVLEPSVFRKSEGDGWPYVTASLEHNPLILGSTSAGTLRLSNNSTALGYEVDLGESRSDVLESVQRRDLWGSSAEFVVYEDDWQVVDGEPVRYLISGKLRDVSLTARPAYPDATVAMRSLSLFVDAPVEDVYELARQGELRSLFTRTDQQVTASVTVPPTPLEVANRNVKEEKGMDTDLARRLLKNAAHRMAIDGDRRALDQLQGKPVGMDLDLARRRLENHWRKMEIDAEEIARLDRQRDVYRPPDVAAQHRQQQAAIFAEATRRRVNQLHQAGFDVIDTSARGTQTLHPSAGPAVPVATQRQQKPVNDGWLGT